MTGHQKSPLARLQRMKNGADTGTTERNLAPVLPLTSLIDAFSIIVIYLLIGTQSGGLEATVPSQMQLPMAQSGTAVEMAPIVRIEKGNYFIDDKPVRTADLGRRLYELKKTIPADKAEILIQADKAMTYASLDPLLRASSQAGLNKLKFAVIPQK